MANIKSNKVMDFGEPVPNRAVVADRFMVVWAIMGKTGLKILVDLDSPHWDKLKDFEVVNVDGIHKKSAHSQYDYQ